MQIINRKRRTFSQENELLHAQSSRRQFFRLSGFFGITTAVIASGVALNSCDKDDDDDNHNTGVDLGTGDTGVLNYAYALEQMEGAFYKKVVDSPYSGISAVELAYLTDIRDGETIHREFFKNVLGSKAIPAIEVDFSSVDFNSRDSVLKTASMFENTGVTAYNGAALLLTDPNNLLLGGKIVSVEARYAALLRDLLNNNSFAGNDVVDAMGMDTSRTPNEVLSIFDPFIKTKINTSNLPT